MNRANARFSADKMGFASEKSDMNGSDGVVAAWLEKAAIYRQHRPGDVELLDHMMLAELGMQSTGFAYEGEIIAPTGDVLVQFRSGGRLSYVNEWLLDRHASSFASLAEMDRLVPNGSYLCRLTDPRGAFELTVSIGGEDNSTHLPGCPDVSLFQDNRAVSDLVCDADVEVRWQAFEPACPGVGELDLFAEPAVFFLLDNCRGETVLSSGSGARAPSLPASSTGFTIPAGTLEPGMRYTAFVSFIDYRAMTQSADGSVGAVCVNSSTVEVPFQTTGVFAEGRSCPPVEQRACYRWPGKLNGGARLLPWPVAASGLTLEPAVQLRSGL